MQTIEIRHNNKRIIPMLILLTTGIIGGSCYIYLSGNFKITNTLILMNTASVVIFIYTLYKPAIKIIKKEPIITLTKDFIEINDNKPVSFLWIQISEWQIVIEENTHYLVLRTADQARKVNISWLDKKPTEIEELIKDYKPK
jgi:ABC-type uncharacterized transport system permease subunit